MTGLSDQDISLFKEGNHTRLYDKLGAHLQRDGSARFAVWAPNAQSVSVIGDFNGWNAGTHPLQARWDHSGIWEGTASAVTRGAAYKYRIVSQHGNALDKGDPYAYYWEQSPRTASRVWTLEYEWRDTQWMHERGERNALTAPMSIYELHLGSWRRAADGEFLNYAALAEALVEHVKKTGFTHVEIMPITEHPFYGSWGYQTTGYFAPTSRYGTPQDFMRFVDTLHQNDIGVILDWVPSHFPNDEFALYHFDGTHLYEHADPRQGYHPDWNSAIFNYGRNEVRAFLISSALFWLDHYHIDGIRVDAVASMLYLDYGRRSGEWIPNRHGGRENLEAISFLRALNEAVYRDHPDVQIMAEESTAWPMVSRPTYVGGLGFGLKWNMGWMHDTLRYFGQDPINRKYHHGEITFSLVYAFHENFALPLSHDEVVHGKGSLIGKMPGDAWRQFANLRTLYGYMWAHPGKKLLFMGSEFGQRREWTHDDSLEWWVLQYPEHSGLMHWVSDLNRLYTTETALHEVDFDPHGFEWVDASDAEQSTLSFVRKSRNGEQLILIVCNFTPVARENYLLGVPQPGYWREMLNSDAHCYGDRSLGDLMVFYGVGNHGGVYSTPVPAHGRYHAIRITLPPLAVLYFKHEH
ncbi:MAG: 1,4-alpha-glucan branching protein GlgB [Pseudomonadota bacterium]